MFLLENPAYLHPEDHMLADNPGFHAEPSDFHEDIVSVVEVIMTGLVIVREEKITLK